MYRVTRGFSIRRNIGMQIGRNIEMPKKFCQIYKYSGTETWEKIPYTIQ